MPPVRRNNVTIGAPFMHAFREASRKRDAKTTLDLRDESGERVISGRMSSGRSTVGVKVLQDDVFANLDSLLNTTNMASMQSLAGVEEVRRSVLNYGIPDISWRTIDEEGVSDIVEELETALLRFEPRIDQRSLGVSRDDEVDKVELKVRFLVSAEIRMNPMNAPMEFMADILTDTGKVNVIQT